MFNEIRSGTAIQYLPCSAHPGTKYSTVRRFLMVRMLGLVVERLGGGHTTNHNETDDQEAGEGTLKEPVRHISYTRAGPAMRSYWSVRA